MFVRSTLGTMSCYGCVVDTGGMSCVVTSEWDMLVVVNSRLMAFEVHPPIETAVFESFYFSIELILYRRRDPS